ncbi:hypothetical protein B9Z31_14315 [Limnohabitans sp. G3-2]|nr:hypothetical protein B9Z31_14285 [Limnohabitans sp. G3-2]PIT71763.1 hypothetical protein B9Z31_14315 [Limnohabitans sp. G3-2]
MEFQQFEDEWKWYQDTKKDVWIESSSGYDEFLKVGDFLYSKSESTRFKKEVRKKFAYDAEHQYELALEQLQADISQNPAIAAAYDRAPDTTLPGVDPSYTGMPRKITSKSLNNQSNVVFSASGGSTIGRVNTTKRDLKIKTIRNSLALFDSNEDCKEIRKDRSEGEVGRSEVVKYGTTSQANKLKQMLEKLKK